MINKQNKKGLVFKNAFFAVIILSLIIIATGVWINDWNTNYKSGLNYDLGTDYNKLNEISNEAGGQQGNISASSSFSNTDFEGTSIKSAFGILNNIYAPFRIVFGNGGMIDATTERFGIPDYIRQGIITMMIMAITFALISILFRRVQTTS